jgi:hypothetical protein
VRNPIVVVLVLIAAAAGAAFAFPQVRDEAQWLAAGFSGHNQDSTRTYLKDWPAGRHAAEARERTDEFGWTTASQVNLLDNYQAYLRDWPSGRHAAEAKNAIEEIDWSEAKASNTFKSLQGYRDRYPTGAHQTEAAAGQTALLADDTPYAQALKTGGVAAINQFLTDYPGHAREADARAALQYAEPRDIMDLIQEAKIEVKIKGVGIESINLKARNKAPHPVSVRVPPGTYFASINDGVQNMVATGETVFEIEVGIEVEISIDVACANAPRAVPTEEDGFVILRSPAQKDLLKLMPALAAAGEAYEVRQAAVWIITDDANYDDLGELVSGGFGGFGGSRAINEYEAARAMQIIQGAGIGIRNHSVWADRRQILNGLEDGELKTWLANPPK